MPNPQRPNDVVSVQNYMKALDLGRLKNYYIAFMDTTSDFAKRLPLTVVDEFGRVVSTSKGDGMLLSPNASFNAEKISSKTGAHTFRPLLVVYDPALKCEFAYYLTTAKQSDLVENPQLIKSYEFKEYPYELSHYIPSSTVHKPEEGMVNSINLTKSFPIVAGTMDKTNCRVPQNIDAGGMVTSGVKFVPKIKSDLARIRTFLNDFDAIEEADRKAGILEGRDRVFHDSRQKTTSFKSPYIVYLQLVLNYAKRLEDMEDNGSPELLDELSKFKEITSNTLDIYLENVRVKKAVRNKFLNRPVSSAFYAEAKGFYLAGANAEEAVKKATETLPNVYDGVIIESQLASMGQKIVTQLKLEQKLSLKTADAMQELADFMENASFTQKLNLSDLAFDDHYFDRANSSAEYDVAVKRMHDTYDKIFDGKIAEISAARQAEKDRLARVEEARNEQFSRKASAKAERERTAEQKRQIEERRVNRGANFVLQNAIELARYQNMPTGFSADCIKRAEGLLEKRKELQKRKLKLEMARASGVVSSLAFGEVGFKLEERMVDYAIASIDGLMGKKAENGVSPAELLTGDIKKAITIASSSPSVTGALNKFFGRLKTLNKGNGNFDDANFGTRGADINLEVLAKNPEIVKLAQDLVATDAFKRSEFQFAPVASALDDGNLTKQEKTLLAMVITASETLALSERVDGIEEIVDTAEKLSKINTSAFGKAYGEFDSTISADIKMIADKKEEILNAHNGDMAESVKCGTKNLKVGTDINVDVTIQDDMVSYDIKTSRDDLPADQDLYYDSYAVWELRERYLTAIKQKVDSLLLDKKRKELVEIIKSGTKSGNFYAKIDAFVKKVCAEEVTDEKLLNEINRESLEVLTKAEAMDRAIDVHSALVPEFVKGLAGRELGKRYSLDLHPEVVLDGIWARVEENENDQAMLKALEDIESKPFNVILFFNCMDELEGENYEADPNNDGPAEIHAVLLSVCKQVGELGITEEQVMGSTSVAGRPFVMYQTVGYQQGRQLYDGLCAASGVNQSLANSLGGSISQEEMNKVLVEGLKADALDFPTTKLPEEADEDLCISWQDGGIAPERVENLMRKAFSTLLVPSGKSLPHIMREVKDAKTLQEVERVFKRENQQSMADLSAEATNLIGMLGNKLVMGYLDALSSANETSIDYAEKIMSSYAEFDKIIEGFVDDSPVAQEEIEEIYGEALREAAYKCSSHTIAERIRGIGELSQSFRRFEELLSKKDAARTSLSEKLTQSQTYKQLEEGLKRESDRAYDVADSNQAGLAIADAGGLVSQTLRDYFMCISRYLMANRFEGEGTQKQDAPLSKPKIGNKVLTSAEIQEFERFFNKAGLDIKLSPNGEVEKVSTENKPDANSSNDDDESSN